MEIVGKSKLLVPSMNFPISTLLKPREACQGQTNQFFGGIKTPSSVEAFPGYFYFHSNVIGSLGLASQLSVL